MVRRQPNARTICDTLLVPSLDEASSHYGVIAEAVSHPPSFASTSFRLRAAARHHDGNPITQIGDRPARGGAGCITLKV